MFEGQNKKQQTKAYQKVQTTETRKKNYNHRDSVTSCKTLWELNTQT